MYSIRQLTLAFGMLFAASAIAAPGARISSDLSASTVGAPDAAPQPTVYEMKRGRSDVQAAKRSRGELHHFHSTAYRDLIT
jgi:hypothetical protein